MLSAQGVASSGEGKIGRLFQVALSSGSVTALKAFIARGASLDDRDGSGRTPLMIVSRRGHFDCAKLLLANGCDASACDGAGLSAKDHASEFGRSDIVELIAAHLDNSTIADSAHAVEPGVRAPSTESGLVEVPADGDEQSLLLAIDSDANATQTDEGAFDDWVEEAVPATPVQDEQVLVRVSDVEQLLSRQQGELDGEEWAEVELFLPKPVTEAETRFEGDAREEIRARLRVASSTGTFLLPAPGDLDTCLDEEALNIVRSVAERAGLLMLEGDDHWPVGAEDGGFEDDQVDELLAEADADLSALRSSTAFERDVGGLAVLDRVHEEDLWRALEQAVDAAALDIARSRSALEFLTATDRLIEAGAMPFAFVSRLETESSNEPTGEADDGDTLADEEDITSSGFLLPAQYEAAIAEISRAQAAHHRDAVTPAEVSRCARAVRNCALSTDFLIWMADELGNGEDNGPVVHSIRAAVRRTREMRGRLVTAHLPHLVKSAARYEGRGLDHDDLVQEGAFGLLRAAELFEPTRGLRFWTYAIWWVRQAMTRAVDDKVGIIRLPVHVREKGRQLDRLREDSGHDAGSLTSAEYVAEKLGTSFKIARFLVQAYEGAQDLEPLPEPGGDPEEDHERGDLRDWLAEDAMEVAVAADLRRVVGSALTSLSPREERVLRMRFGIGMPTDHTLEEVGEQFDVTRERIRQIEAKGLKKLKHPIRSRRLRSFVD